MIIKQYIKDFEKLGFGMFVHFGPYSVYGHGEWAKSCLQISDETYEGYVSAFCPKESWARELAEAAAAAFLRRSRKPGPPGHGCAAAGLRNWPSSI